MMEESSTPNIWAEYKLYKADRLQYPDVPYYKWRKKYPNAALHYEDFFEIQLKKQGENDVTNSTD